MTGGEGEITVTGVELEDPDDGELFIVRFSEPVYLYSPAAPEYDLPSPNYADTWWYCEAPDELGAYVWGLKVIEQHKLRVKKEQTNGT